MGRITALYTGKGRKKQVNVFLDGKFAFSLDAEVVAQEKLQVEQVLSDEQVEMLIKTDNLKRCLNAAVHYLGYRPRSEPELRGRLRRRGFNDDSIETVVTRLKELSLVNDDAFARFWKENRESFSPRSQWLTRFELRQKGVAEEIIDQVVDTIDDEDSAYRAALKKSRSLSRTDYQSYRRRLGEHLKRRGFSYRVINNVINRLWHDQAGKNMNEEIREY
jgi:regulatory protein